ncbi:ATPase, AAA family, partial [Ancylostoma caninum]
YKIGFFFKSIRVDPQSGTVVNSYVDTVFTFVLSANVSYDDVYPHLVIHKLQGPELLSKYIGSSEENVRNVFERARASSPCIIIFDELDSLAPQRGSDNTGVTDRVVNQLLTEMDGAEGLQGLKMYKAIPMNFDYRVYVIGCTSRMDLIDPALLRPGRFDHILECGIPNKEDRADIFRIILRSVDFDPELSITEWVARTDGWTGADLKALITNAQFDAMRKTSNGEAKDSCVYHLVLYFERAYIIISLSSNV